MSSNEPHRDLQEIFTKHPWLKEELARVNDKFKMLNTPMGKIMMGKATIAEMSKKSGMDAETIIGKICDLIKAHWYAALRVW